MIFVIVIVVLVIAVLGGWCSPTTGWCGCATRRHRASRAIDIQLKRRADLIPNLVEAVKAYAAHEKGRVR